MPQDHFSQLLAERQFMRFWLARLTGVMANQMLMVALAWHIYDITSSAWVLVGGFGTVLVATAWLRLFPALARRDRMLP